ncbi:MAG: ketopantoate reductase family protein [Clostridia bacterium]|nr:ketopantoate reductase family protein [Clostridia bacterium]
MRIAIYGAGSLGTILGAYLEKDGLSVDLFTRNKAHVDAMNEYGAKVTGTVDFTQKVKAYTPDMMEGVYDIIFLLTKQLENRSTAEFLKDHLSSDGALCTLQNGLPEYDLIEILGKDRVCGATVGWGATLEGPGISRLTSSPDSLTFGMGDIEGFPHEKLLKVSEILSRMGTVENEENFIGARWTKLLINSVFSGMGTVIGGTFGDVTKDKEARNIAQYALKECVDVGKAMGVEFAKIQGFDVVKLMYFSNPLKKAIAALIMPIAMKKHKDIEPSMLQDLKKGKPCEIDAINGEICRYGDITNTDTPVNDMIVKIVREYQESGKIVGKESLKRFAEIIK